MSKLGNRFGVDVEKIKTRSFEYGGHTFKVRIPTMGEISAFEETIEAEKQNGEAIQTIFDERSKGLTPSDDVVFAGKDIIVKGRSLFEASQAEHLSRLRITWMFNLLVKEVDDGQGDLTYEDIASELPIQVQMDIVDGISRAMHPDIEETKKKYGEIPESNFAST